MGRSGSGRLVHLAAGTVAGIAAEFIARAMPNLVDTQRWRPGQAAGLRALAAA